MCAFCIPALLAGSARPVVLLTPPKSSHPRLLLSRQHLAPITPLAATLMNLPASVANKRVMAWLTPLDATLTENMGVGATPHDVSTFRPSAVQFVRLLQPGFLTGTSQTSQRDAFSIYPLFFQALPHSFAPREPCNPFTINSFHTLSIATGVYPIPFHQSQVTHHESRDTFSAFVLVHPYLAELNRFCIQSPIVPWPPPGYTLSSTRRTAL